MCRAYTSHSALVGRPFSTGPLAGVTVPAEALTAFVLDFVQQQLSRMFADGQPGRMAAVSVFRAQGRFADCPVQQRQCALLGQNLVRSLPTLDNVGFPAQGSWLVRQGHLWDWGLGDAVQEDAATQPAALAVAQSLISETRVLCVSYTTCQSEAGELVSRRGGRGLRPIPALNQF